MLCLLSQVCGTFGDRFALTSSAVQDGSPISGRSLDVLVDEMTFSLFAPCLTTAVSSQGTRIFAELFVVINFLFAAFKRGLRVSLIVDAMLDLLDRKRSIAFRNGFASTSDLIAQIIALFSTLLAQ